MGGRGKRLNGGHGKPRNSQRAGKESDDGTHVQYVLWHRACARMRKRHRVCSQLLLAKHMLSLCFRAHGRAHTCIANRPALAGRAAPLPC
jgi:hypothetical protein